MKNNTHQDMVNFIWNICNLLRGPYKRNEYRKVILPLTVLRRFDCILSDTKDAVLKQYESIKGKSQNYIDFELTAITGVPFYNLSKLNMEKLLNDPNNLAQNLVSYINGFSTNISEIMERFSFDDEIVKMNERDLLYKVVKEFAQKVDLSPAKVDNINMGYIFEELIRIGSEQSNEEAGEHFTPREVIKLMVNLLLAPESEMKLSDKIVKIYDPTCGTGGMLSVADEYIKDMNKTTETHLYKYTDIKPLVAFSGEVIDPSTDEKYTEPSMNKDADGKSISEKQLPEKFSTSEFKILLVANKYQTGFDQPLLCAMYVDKRLDGVQAVQTLSRLNRCYPGKKEPFILDFVNNPEDIYEAFKPYYDATELEKETDPMQLETLKAELDKMRVYTSEEVNDFAQVFYKPIAKQKPSDHAKMESFALIAKDRFSLLAEEEKELFQGKMSAFVRLYAFVSQIITYTDEEWEKLYTYSRFLLPHLHIDSEYYNENPQEDIALTHLRNQKVAEHIIDISEGESIKVTSPTEVGTAKEKDPKVPLSVLIDALNEKFGTDFTDEDRLFFEQIMEKAQNNDEVRRKAKTNSDDKFELGIQEIIKKLMMVRMKENEDIVSRYLDDEAFQKTALRILAREIYANLNDDVLSKV